MIQLHVTSLHYETRSEHHEGILSFLCKLTSFYY